MPVEKDPYSDLVRYYDSENAEKTDDLPFYQALYERFGGPVLCVGSGTGRVVFPLVKAGARVVGIDFSEAMIVRAEAAAREKSYTPNRVSWIHGDIRTLRSEERFALIIFPYNGFMHLHTPADQIAALSAMAAHLTPGGAIALALPNPIELFVYDDDEEPALEREFIDHDTGDSIIQSSQIAQDRAAQLLFIQWFYQRINARGKMETDRIPVTLRLSFAPELSLLCAAAGLGEVTFYGDHDLTPYDEDSPHLLVLARAKEG